MYSYLLMLLFNTFLSFYISAKSVSNDWSLLKLPTVWRPLLDPTVSVLYIAWFGIQCLLYVLPFGGEVVQGLPGKHGYRFSYRLNGFFVLAVNIAGFLVAYLSGLKVSTIADKTWELTLAVFLFHYVLSVVLMLTARFSKIPDYNVNSNAKMGSVLQDWLLGKTISPRIGFLDVKLVVSRSLMIAVVLYQFAIVAKFYDVHTTSNYSLLLAVGMQLLYIVDCSWFEWTMINVKEMANDGCGALLLMLGVSILIQSSVAVNVIAAYNIQLPWYCLLAIAGVFMYGYYMYRMSNGEKSRYRQNPDAHEFKDYEVISTARGTNLLVSGWWGMCRHPNYLGDIIMNTAMAMPAGLGFVFAYFNPLMVTLMMMDREKEDSKECKKKYGDDWDTYCHRVRYRLIPGVY